MVDEHICEYPKIYWIIYFKRVNKVHGMWIRTGVKKKKNPKKRYKKKKQTNKTSGVNLEVSCLQMVAMAGIWGLGLLYVQLSEVWIWASPLAPAPVPEFLKGETGPSMEA